MMQFPELLLASKSPRRSMLLKEAGFRFSLVEAEVEEVYPEGLVKAEVAEYLSGLKADAVSEIPDEKVLVTADTIVCLGNEVIGKPRDEEDAIRMLKKLQGNMHEVYTGISLRSKRKSVTFSEKTEVWFRQASETEIRFYIDRFKPLDKAGSYGIQEWFGYNFVSGINGDFYNVMGLPVSRLYFELKNFI